MRKLKNRIQKPIYSIIYLRCNEWMPPPPSQDLVKEMMVSDIALMTKDPTA